MKRFKREIAVFLIAMFLLPNFLTVSVVEAKEKNLGEKYEKRVVSSISRERLSGEGIEYTDNDEMLTEDELKMLEESYKDKESYEVLVPKTESNYEVALSYEDGSYTYFDCADTYDEAVEKAKVKGKTLEKSYESQVVVPTVIDNLGQNVYATLSIARSWKVRKYGTGTKVSYVYSNSALTNRYTYIHDGYLSEMPIIQENQNEAKILVAGYEGWLNKNVDRQATDYTSPNRDIQIEPITHVTNPCYYRVKDGFLIHHISVSMTGTGTYPEKIGVAPSYLKEGHIYYSYDGNYFYDGSQGIAAGLSNLTMDLQSRSHGRAVNANNPFYNYYSYLPFRSKTNYTADEINRYINNNTASDSKLRGLGQAFINAQNTYGVNALLALGIAMNESAGGSSPIAKAKNNLFGLNATDSNPGQDASTFSSPAACVDDFAKNWISRSYADPQNWTFHGGYLGNKKYGANVQYASDPYWGEKAINFAFDVEVYLSGGNVSKMKDYNYYQLLMYTGEEDVAIWTGYVLYPVQYSINTSSSNVGAVVASTGRPVCNFNGRSCYEFYPDRTTNIGTGRFQGYYGWDTKAYISTNKVKLINKGRNLLAIEDLNMDGKINQLDLALLGNSYNKTKSSSGWNSGYDINGDGIIDIYDIVKIAAKM